MQATFTLPYLNSASVNNRQWLIALVIAVLVHTFAFITYRSFNTINDVGAKALGEQGIQIGLKKLLPSPSKKQVIQPQPKLKPKPKPEPKPAPVVIPEVMEEPEPEEIQEEVSSEETVAVDESMVGGGNPDLEITYSSRLLSWLEHFKRYPLTARRRGQEDIIFLQFTIDGDGKLISYTLTNPSKFTALNEAVEEMIKQASPMPEIPEELRQGKMQFLYTVPVEFKLSR